MNDYAVAIAPGVVRMQRVLPGPIERVWAYLTDSKLRGQWLAAGEMEMRIGGKVTLTFHHSQLSSTPEQAPERFSKAEGYSFTGRVTQLDPPKLLSYTWAESYGESEVTFELAPQASDVLLTITHRRLAAREDMVNVAGGWHTHVAILIDRLNERASPGFWGAFEKVELEYARRFAGAEGAAVSRL